MTNNEEKVLKAFKQIGSAARPGQIAEITGIEKTALTKILKKLKNEEKIIVPKRCYYSLP